MGAARHFTELDVWKLSDEVRQKVLLLTTRPTFRRHRWLRQQLDKAADSACSNTAEGFGRFYPSEFVSFLRIVRGSLNEVASRAGVLVTLGLASRTEGDELRAQADRAARATTGLIKYLEGPGGQSWNRRR